MGPLNAGAEPEIASVLAQLSALLGPENVVGGGEALEKYTKSTAAIQRKLLGAVTPCTTEQVQSVVRVANEFKVPLYPLSQGKNWGYGSSLPVRDGAMIVDLRRMKRIRNEIGMAAHYAVIEPGVTQGQLLEHLRSLHLPLLFNATAAGRETSILGNSLDRGFGYFAMRPNDITALEVVLGNGEILRTGYGHWDNAKVAAEYGFGLGPSLDGLFFQSNFGIVTSAALHLHPKRECHVTLLLKLAQDDDFIEFVNILASLRRESIIESVLHIGSRQRLRVTLSPLVYEFLVARGEKPSAELRARSESIVAGTKSAAWTGVGGLYGTRGEVDERLKEIKRRLEGVAAVDIASDETLAGTATPTVSVEAQALSTSAQALVDFSSGIPSDGALLSPLWAIGISPGEVADLDDSRLGLLFCCPALPLDGHAVRNHIATAERVFEKHGFTPYMTLNIVNTKCVLCVLNIVFDRTDAAQSSQAHRCIDTLFDAWAAEGIYPYRLGVQSMSQSVRAEDPYWRTVGALKEVFDPNRIIAPGRYNLD